MKRVDYSEKLKKAGYEIIKEYYYKNGIRRIVARDRLGYLYDTFADCYINNNPKKVHIKNPYSIHNISNFLKIEKSTMRFAEEEFYSSYNLDLNMYCSKCDEYLKMSWNNILSKRGSCPICKNQRAGKSHNLLYSYPEIEAIWDYKKNKKEPNQYRQKSNIKVWWLCKDGKHSSYKRNIYNSVKCKFRCPKCTRERRESLIQEKVRTYIEENLGYSLLHEEECSISPINPKTKYRMFFDNEIKELKLIIEVNGIQHYREIGFFHGRGNKPPKENFLEGKERDKYKRNYAKKMGYEFLVIRYKDVENGKFKEKILKKINNILNFKRTEQNGQISLQG